VYRVGVDHYSYDETSEIFQGRLTVSKQYITLDIILLVIDVISI